MSKKKETKKKAPESTVINLMPDCYGDDMTDEEIIDDLLGDGCGLQVQESRPIAKKKSGYSAKHRRYRLRKGTNK